jgi:hypothetical protein
VLAQRSCAPSPASPPRSCPPPSGCAPGGSADGGTDRPSASRATRRGCPRGAARSDPPSHHPPPRRRPCGAGRKSVRAPPRRRIDTARECARSDSFALFPLPSTVPVTRVSTSWRRPWFPPDVHANTGRLRSDGSACRTFPVVVARMQPSDSLPPSALGLLTLAVGLPRRGWRSRRRHTHPLARRPPGSGHRRPAAPDIVEERHGPPRCLGRPVRACRVP